MNKTPQVFVALDYANPGDAQEFIAKVSPNDCGLKIGKQLFTMTGPDFVKEQIDRGFAVFLDLKFHDIPNTVAGAVQSASKLGVRFLTVHAMGGAKMLSAAAHATTGMTEVLAVTVLTSHDDSDLAKIGFNMSADKLTTHLATLACHNGVKGLVCASQDVPHLRESLPLDCCFVTPGIRLTMDDSDDDQSRIMTPKMAINAGSNHLVIGRPITQAPDPTRVLHEINLTIQGAHA